MARIFLERREMDDDLRRLFDQLIRTDAPAHAEYSVPLDVVETSEGIEVLVDLAGVHPDAVQVVVARDTMVVSGHKKPRTCEHHGQATFHVAERVFGRFGRAVRLTGSAFDVGRGEATLRAGVLRVRLPRIEDRRGREHRIPVRTD